MIFVKALPALCPRKFEWFLRHGMSLPGSDSHLEPGCSVRLAFGSVSSSFPRSSQLPHHLENLNHIW